MEDEKNITENNCRQVANCDQLSSVENRIMTIRDVQVILDRDLADLYGVETKVLNQSVKRNIERFPRHFRFQLSKYEMDELVTNCDRFKILKHSTVCPFAFTEQGIAMLASVLRSETAIRVSIRIMDAFVSMRHFLINNADVFRRLSTIGFLCIDDVVYHIGASIKDLGKKWFAFAKMEVLTPTELVEKINE